MSEEQLAPLGTEQTVAVIGLGLMGGSLCRALKALPEPPRVLGADVAPIHGTRALADGSVDRFDLDPLSIASGADVVVYATPMGVTLSLVREHAARWDPSALVTDMVSLKSPVLRVADRAGGGERFVGAHPVCGGEGSGYDAGRSDLFRGASVWLCSGPEVDTSLRSRAEAFWTAIGARPQWIGPGEHDERMAWVSHLPQLVANALAGALDAAGYHPDDLGPGGRDMTRLAASNPEMWKDLLEASAPVTGTGLTSVSKALNVLGDLLARREVERIAEFMERTRIWREGGSDHGSGG